MRTSFQWCFLAFVVLAFSGCVKHSVVVKVNRDGTGVVHVRHFEEVPTGLFAVNSAKNKPPRIPSQEQVDALARAMGEGVVARPVKRAKDANGWEGYEILFDVKDVNNLVLNQASLKELTTPNTEKKDEATRGKDEDSLSPELVDSATLRELKIRMRAGVLTLQPKFGGGVRPAESGETIDPFAGSAGTGGFTSKVALSLGSQFLGAARLGFFVQVEPGIQQTDAQFVRGKQIAIVNVNLGQLASPRNLEANLALLDELTVVSGQSRKRTQEICREVRGLDVDMNEKITVKLK